MSIEWTAAARAQGLNRAIIQAHREMEARVQDARKRRRMERGE